MNKTKNIIVGFHPAVDEPYYSIECTTDLDTNTRRTNVYYQGEVPFYKVRLREDSAPEYIVAYEEMPSGYLYKEMDEDEIPYGVYRKFKLIKKMKL